jgi:hypothetical protein
MSKKAAILIAIAVGIAVLLFAPARIINQNMGYRDCTGSFDLSIYDLCQQVPHVTLTWAWLLGNRYKDPAVYGQDYKVQKLDAALDLVAAVAVGAGIFVLLRRKRRAGKS